MIGPSAIPSLPAAAEGAAPPVPAIAAAWRRSALGMIRRGHAQVRAPLAALDDDTSAGAAHARLLGGEVLRRAGAFADASDQLLRAAVDLARPDPRRPSAGAEVAKVALALAAESALLPGSLAHAAERVERVIAAGQVTAEVAVPARAVIDLYRGKTVEARTALRSLPEAGPDRWANLWLALWQAEAMLELGAIAGLEQALDRADASLLHEERFAEPHVRACAMRAALEVMRETARANDGSGEADGSRELARSNTRAALTRLARYAQAFPLYQAWHAQLEGEAALLARHDPEPSFRRVAAILDGCGAVALKARLLTRQVSATRKAEERGSARRLIEARTLLIELGADARLGELSGRKSAEAMAPARRSVAMRLEGLNLTDDVGLEAVFEVSRHLASIRRLDELLDKILESVTRVLKAERGALLRLEEDGGLTCAAAKGLDPDQVREGGGAVSFGVVREAERTGEPVLSDNALGDARFAERASVMATDIRSVVCCPIRTALRTYGFVYLDRRLVDVAFDSTHLDLLAAFCTQVAVAWENAQAFEEIERLNVGLEQKVKERTVALRETNEELANSLEELTNTRLKLAEAQRDALETEMKLARDIQQAILPPEAPVARDGVRIVGRVIPASFCGGDFWALRPLDNGATLIVVADVTGHGVAASLITAVARSCLDTLGHASALDDVGGTLVAMNEVIHRAASGQLCATAFACVIEAGGRHMHFANAGHNFPYVLPTSGGPQPLVARGSRLGEESTASFETHERALHVGERLVLYSDGIVEWENDRHKAFGDRRFLKALAASREAPAETAIQEALTAAEKFAKGTECDDDIMVVIADVT